MQRSIRVTLFAVTAALTFGRRVSAQAPEGSRFLSQQAVAESLKVLKQLNSDVRANYKDAAAWYRQGMIAAALYERCRVQPKLSNVDCTKPRLLADSALLIARELEPTNPEYVLALGRFLLAADVTFYRDASYFKKLFGASLDAARKTGDPIVYADAALNMGRYYWLEYTAKSHRPAESAEVTEVRRLAAKLLGNDGRAIAADSAADSADAGRVPLYSREALVQARRALDAKRISPARGFGGEIEYLIAEMLYREAFDAAPGYLRAYRAYAVLLAEQNRWNDIGTMARSRLDASPNDGWAWMTFGMARYRQGLVSLGVVAFDSAIKYLPAADRGLLTDFERALGANQRTLFSKVDDDKRGEAERLYWLTADPLWSRNDDPPKAEFLARVAYAELVWTLDELRQHGADSDRGEVYIRNGPPDRISSARGEGAYTGFASAADGGIPAAGGGGGASDGGGTAGRDVAAAPGGDRECQTGSRTPGAGLVADVGWMYFEYDYSGAKFKFPRVPIWGCRFGLADSVAHRAMSARWDNLIKGRIDSMPSQLARFRGPGDSTDVLLAMLPPINAIRRGSDVESPVRTDFWFITPAADVVVRNSVKPAVPGIASVRPRLASGEYIYRTESSADGSMVAGRASAKFTAGDDARTGYTSAGAGISDLLLATRAEAKTRRPARWRDLDLAPLAGPIAHNSDLTVVWENYDFARDNSNTVYGLTITLRRERPDTSTTPNIAAQIVSGIVDAVGLNRKVQQDRVEFAFDRTVQFAPAIVDFVTLSLGTTPPGAYLVTLQVTDRVSGRTFGRSQRLVIAPPSAPPPK